MLLSMLQSYGESSGNTGTFGGLCGGLVGLAFALLYIVGMWKLFTKAGRPGIAALVPCWNFIVLLDIAGKSLWWILLFCIPGVNIIASLLVHISIAKAFGKGALYGVLMAVFPIFVPILGFSDARYLGPQD